MNEEPVSIAGATAIVLSTGVALVAVFDPGLTQAAQIAIIAFGNALIGLGAIIYARRKSTPTAAPVLDKGTTVTVVTPGDAPNQRVTV